MYQCARMHFNSGNNNKQCIERSILNNVRCDQLKNKSSRRVTYGNPCYSIGSKANSIYFLNDRSVCIMYIVMCGKKTEQNDLLGSMA
jgi:hypothetical protein